MNLKGMNSNMILACVLLAACACAQQPESYSIGKLLDMDSVQCGTHQALSNNTAHAADSVAAPTQAQAVCPEYVLETDEVTYKIVSRNAKHPAPLPIGEFARFRLKSGKMLLRVPALDNKEREYVVVSMTPRGQSAADASPIRLNHLQ
ncbi:MAG TPA: hypothetical protein VMF10_03025 [Candidatus Aquilonibacter sp.]|nr:hypothetical protein [Candidatus Aquilonibacter sp.]